MEMTAGSLSPEAMFRMAQSLGDDRLTAILSGRDNAVPQFVAQAVLSERQRIRQAQAGQQARQQMMQQQPSKREELLAQAQNTQGIASVAPDSVAQMAGGGIVAFSGEDGQSEVRANRSFYDQYNWEDLPKVERPRASSLSELIGNVFSRSDLRIDPSTKKPVTFGDFMRNKERAGVENARIALGQDFTTGLPLSKKSSNEAPSAPAAATPVAATPVAATPVRGGGGGEGGGRAAAVGAAPAATKAAEFNVDRYFRPLGNEPQLGPVTVANPYEKPISVEEYITKNKALLKKFGVEENPYAEREAALRARQAAAGEEQNKADALDIIKMGADIARSREGVGQALGTGISLGIDRKLARDKEFAAAKDKRDEALQAIKIAQNEIKIGHVKTGIEQLNTATKNYNDAQGRIEDMTARRQEQQAQQQTQLYGVTTQADIARGQAAIQAELELRKLAQQLQISEAQLKAEYAKIGAMRASGGPRTPAEIQLVERLISDPKFAEGYKLYVGIKNPEDPKAAAFAKILRGEGGGNPPPGAVREKGK
jgi:hypothetical protein